MTAEFTSVPDVGSVTDVAPVSVNVPAYAPANVTAPASEMDCQPIVPTVVDPALVIDTSPVMAAAVAMLDALPT